MGSIIRVSVWLITLLLANRHKPTRFISLPQSGPTLPSPNRGYPFFCVAVWILLLFYHGYIWESIEIRGNISIPVLEKNAIQPKLFCKLPSFAWKLQMKSPMDKMCGHIVVHDAGDKRSHVMTMTKYGAIHPSKYRFTPLQWSGILTKHLALCYIVFTFSPDVLSYIGIASRPSMQLPPALLHGVGLFFAIESPPSKAFQKLKQKKKPRIIRINERFWAFTCRRRGSNPYSVSRKGF